MAQPGWLRPALLALAIVLYGALSSPTPDAPGSREALIGVLLVLAAGFRQPAVAITGVRAIDRDAPGLERVGAAALALLFWLPLLRGLALDWQPTAIVRDIIPLFYLFAPVLLGRLLTKDAAAQHLVAAALALAGVLFSVRFFLISGLDPADIGRRAGADLLLYLPNSPCVLFGAVGLGVFAFRPSALTGPAALCASLAALVGSLLCLAALAATVQRGPLVLAVAAFLAFYAWRARRSGLALLLGAAILAGLSLAFHQPAVGVLALIQEKTALVGANARADEFTAVLDQIGRDPISLLFGDGWGALVASPAVGGLRVGYTHTFLSYVLLKSGLVGIMAVGAYLLPVCRAATVAVRLRPTLALAVLPPLLLGATVTTSFKFLDFGLLLALLCGAGTSARTAPAPANMPLLRRETTC